MDASLHIINELLLKLMIESNDIRVEVGFSAQ